MIDTSNYNDGKRGGKVRVRAHIEEFDKKTLLIKDVPYSVTTTQLMESITKANDQGKIKKLDALRMMKETTFSRLT